LWFIVLPYSFTIFIARGVLWHFFASVRYFFQLTQMITLLTNQPFMPNSKKYSMLQLSLSEFAAFLAVKLLFYHKIKVVTAW